MALNTKAYVVVNTINKRDYYVSRSGGLTNYLAGAKILDDRDDAEEFIADVKEHFPDDSLKIQTIGFIDDVQRP